MKAKLNEGSCEEVTVCMLKRKGKVNIPYGNKEQWLLMWKMNEGAE